MKPIEQIQQEIASLPHAERLALLIRCQGVWLGKSDCDSIAISKSWDKRIQEEINAQNGVTGSTPVQA